MSNSNARRRTAQIYLSIPGNLLDSFYQKAYYYSSIPKMIEHKIINANDLKSESVSSSLTFQKLNLIGQKIKQSINTNSHVSISELDQIISFEKTIEAIGRKSKRISFRDQKGKRIPVDSFNVRVLPEIHDKAKMSASAAGLPIPQYTLKLILGHPIYPAPSKDDARVISELGKIRGLLMVIEKMELFNNEAEFYQIKIKVDDILFNYSYSSVTD
ncbi:plasmid mobilization protein [Elstera litoralis]|uniref:plasmid mobilization protein n=1 Tax=Elstera litoralis TaxID=552518 RepID=UPI0012ECD501|nr:toxin-antitoxin system HicB family antitoxin [Elstera litoralis]